MTVVGPLVVDKQSICNTLHTRFDFEKYIFMSKELGVKVDS